MCTFDVAAEYKVLNDFFNRCISAKKTIKFTGDGLHEAQESYNLYNESDCIEFILNKVKGNVIAICEPQHLHYDERLPIVHEYVFIYKLEDDEKGCLAFFKNPRENDQIKVKVKSLHKNYQDKEFEDKHVIYLELEEKMNLLE